jgi:tetratricopeptide (TPR) repeat protein
MKTPTRPSELSWRKHRAPLWKRTLARYSKLHPFNKIAIWLLVVSIPLGWLSIKLLRPAYHAWKQGNALSIAHSAIARGDLKAASLAFRQAVRADPSKPRVWRELIPFLRDQKSPDLFFAWDRLIRYQPDAVENHLGAAEDAIASGNADRARVYLHDVPIADRDSTAYRVLNAKVLMAEQRAPEAAALLEKIVAQDPSNEEAQFQLNVIRLADPASPGHFGAMVAMRALAEGSGSRAVAARRLLIRAEAADRDFLAASSDAAILIGRQDATVEDRILFLDLEFATASFDLPNSINSFLEWALAHPVALEPVANYLINRGKGAETLKWLREKAAGRENEPGIRSALLALALSERDWDLVFQVLATGDQPIPSDVLSRLKDAQSAYRADRDDAGQRWDDLLDQAGGNLAMLSTFEQLSHAWGWDDARKKTLYKIASIIPSNPLVWRMLLAMALADRNAPEIASILTSLVQADPTSRQMSDAWIRFQVLLNRGNQQDLVALAKTNLDLTPGVPTFQLTYALTLAMNDRAVEALSVLDSMSPAAREEITGSPFIAYIDAKGGRMVDARAALDRMKTASRTWLPEELALAARAGDLIAGKPEHVEIAPETNEGRADEILKELRERQARDASDSAKVLNELLQQRKTDASGASRQLDELRSELHAEDAPTK